MSLIAFSVPEMDLHTALLPLRYAWRRTIKEGIDVACFEMEFARYIGVKYAICFSSARYALLMLYRYFKCANKKVVIPAYTCIPAVDAIRWAGAKPYFVDVDIDTYNPMFDESMRKLDDIAAVSLSYLYGLIGEIEPFLKFARERCIPVIEDAGICIGGSIEDRKVGSLGDAAVFSLQSSKILTAWKGGVITTNDEDLYRYLCRERDALPFPRTWKLLFNVYLTYIRTVLSHRSIYGFTLYPIKRLLSIRWIHRIVCALVHQDPTEALTGESTEDVPREEGVRFTNLQAALALYGLRNIDGILSRRRQYAEALSEGLRCINAVSVPGQRRGVQHAYGRYPIVIGDLEKRVLQKAFLRFGIEVGLYYPYICPHTRYLQADGLYPTALRASKATVLLPMHTFCDSRDVRNIIEAVRKISEASGKYRAEERYQQ